MNVTVRALVLPQLGLFQVTIVLNMVGLTQLTSHNCNNLMGGGPETPVHTMSTKLCFKTAVLENTQVNL